MSNYKVNRSVTFYANSLCITPKYLTMVVKEVSGKSAKDWKRVGNDKEEIRYILEELNNIILEKTRAGEKVCIQGFGVYTPRLQTSRLARNPKSGETLMLIPRTIVHFKCAPNLLKEINK